MTPENVSAEVLLARAADDEQSWYEFYRRFDPRVEAIVKSMLREPRFANDVDDVCQDAFMSMLRYIRDSAAGRPIDNASAWVYRVATNAAIAFFRKQKSRRAFDTVALEQLSEQGQDIPADVPTQDEILWSKDEPQRFRDLTKDLGPAQKAVLTLLFVDGLTVAQIAENLGISENAVRINKHRALPKVRDAVQQANPGVGR